MEDCQALLYVTRYGTRPRISFILFCVGFKISLYLTLILTVLLIYFSISYRIPSFTIHRFISVTHGRYVSFYRPTGYRPPSRFGPSCRPEWIYSPLLPRPVRTDPLSILRRVLWIFSDTTEVIVICTGRGFVHHVFRLETSPATRTVTSGGAEGVRDRKSWKRSSSMRPIPISESDRYLSSRVSRRSCFVGN